MLVRRHARLAAAAVLAFATAILPLATPVAAQAPPLIAIDAGHGGGDVGASARVDGRLLVEKDLNLEVARQVARLLEGAGYRTLMTRTTDAAVNKGKDANGDGKVDLADELQARVDMANSAGASVLLSIHFNGSRVSSLRGPEFYYSTSRPFSDQSKRLAEAIRTAVAARLGRVGTLVPGRGVLPDSQLGAGHLFLLGPKGGPIARPSAMPGVLTEGLYMTNPDDAKLLADPRTIEAFARAYADGVVAYLGPAPVPDSAVVVGEQGANLRPSPLLGTKPLALLPHGTTVDLAERVTGDAVRGLSEWWRVDWKGQAGFVFGRLLSPRAEPEKPSGPRVATVRDDGDGLSARLRAAPNREAAIVARAKPGSVVSVVAQGTGEKVDGKTEQWLKVRSGAIEGWVWAPLVEG